MWDGSNCRTPAPRRETLRGAPLGHRRCGVRPAPPLIAAARSAQTRIAPALHRRSTVRSARRATLHGTARGPTPESACRPHIGINLGQETNRPPAPAPGIHRIATNHQHRLLRGRGQRQRLGQRAHLRDIRRQRERRDDTTTCSRFGNRFGSDSRRPITMRFASGQRLKCLRSAERCQGMAPSRPITPLRATAAIKASRGRRGLSWGDCRPRASAPDRSACQLPHAYAE